MSLLKSIKLGYAVFFDYPYQVLDTEANKGDAADQVALLTVTQDLPIVICE